MSASLAAFVQGFPIFLLYSIVAGVMLILACALYIKLTPWRELALVRNGNASAGLALAGAIVGLAIPISAALASSVSLVDVMAWGSVALLMQLIAFRVTDMFLKDLPGRIREDEAGAAIILISTKLASAMILAAGIWAPMPG